MNSFEWLRVFGEVLKLLLLITVIVQGVRLYKTSRLSIARSLTVIACLVASFVCSVVSALGGGSIIPQWILLFVAVGCAFLPSTKSIRDKLVTNVPKCVRFLAMIQLVFGSLLLILGVLSLYLNAQPADSVDSSRLFVFLRVLKFPWMTLGLLQLILAWTLLKNSKWQWMPNLLLIILWAVSPAIVYRLLISGYLHDIGVSYSESNPLMFPLMFTAIAIGAIPPLLLFTQWVVFLRDSDWIDRSEEQFQFSLGQFLLCCVLVPAMIGIDVKVLLQAKQASRMRKLGPAEVYHQILRPKDALLLGAILQAGAREG